MLNPLNYNLNKQLVCPFLQYYDLCQLKNQMGSDFIKCDRQRCLVFPIIKSFDERIKALEEKKNESSY